MLHIRHLSAGRYNRLSQLSYNIIPPFALHSHCYLHSTTKPIKQKTPFITTSQQHTTWNFNSIDTQSCQIDCLVIQNNPNYNRQWLRKIIPQTDMILLADGGANIFYEDVLEKEQGQNKVDILSRIKGVIGDLDSITENAQKFYKQSNIQLIKVFNQQKNDFEKTLSHGLSLGCQNIIISGAFGDRLDHTLSTMSITERYIKQNKQINLLLTNGSSLYCPLRNGYNKILMSNDIQREGCGLVTFGKAKNVVTRGFRWDLGKGQKRCEIQWGKFLSTSNEIVGEEVDVEIKGEENGVVYFVANFRQGKK